MIDGFEIDLDGEQVLFDGTWFSKEELARKIKTMVDGGDYRVSRPSAALEALENGLGSLRTLTLRLPAGLVDALAAAAARQGQPVSAFLREALRRALPDATHSPTPQPGGTIPLPLSAAMTITEAASADEAAAAVPLTPKRREDSAAPAPPTDPEQSWFTRR